MTDVDKQELLLNLSAWIERRKDHLSPSYADHIIHSVKQYEDALADQQKRIAELEHATEAFAGAIAEFVKEKHGGNLTREDFLTLINEPSSLHNTGKGGA